jgi:hypothetical protein
MPNLTKLRSFKMALCACATLLAGAPAFAQHVHVGYAGGWHGGYHGGYGGWHGGYYGWHGGYYGWRGGYYYGWPGYYYGPWGWWGAYGPYPYYYSSDWWGGAPYWNGTAGQYASAAPPEGMANQGGDPPAGPPQPVVDPKNGQSAEQQGKDTFECHRWAVGQTGFDPTQGAPGNRSAYLRAQAACLEGRGYTVK